MAELGNLAGSAARSGSAGRQHEEVQRKVRPLLPCDDPFYQPPAGYQHAEPGTVLRSRDVELAFLGLIPQPVTAIQLLYRTMDMNGNPEATVTTVIVPAEHAPGQPCPLLSYQCAIDAMSSRCFPSYALRRRAKALGSVSQFELLVVAAALAEGWAVSIPDHEGLHGMWGAPYEPGYRVLDGIRAALTLGTHRAVPRCPDRAVGILRRWAGQRVGCRNVRRLRARTGHRRGGAGIARRRPGPHLPPAQRQPSSPGCRRWWWPRSSHIYPDLDRVIKEHTNEEGRTMLERLEKMTTVEAVIRMARKDMGDYLDEPLEDILATPEVSHVFDSIKLGAAVPKPPVLDRAGRARLPHRRRTTSTSWPTPIRPAAPASPTTATRSTSTWSCTRCPPR